MNTAIFFKAFSKRHLKQKLRELSFRLFRAVTPNLKSIVLEDDAGHAIVAVAHDNFITFECVKYGRYVSSPVLQAIDLYKSLGLPLGGTFLDVGANVGTETVTALKSGAFSRGIAIEPVVDNLRNLRMALCANELSSAVQVVPCAVSNQPGVLRMRMSPTNAGDHRIVDGESAGGAFMDVEVKTIDEVVARIDSRSERDVCMIFIDVQGHEPEALEGASRLLRSGIPLVMEYSPNDMARDGKTEKLLHVLRGHYDSYVVLGESASLQSCDIEGLVELRDSPHEHLDLFIYRRQFEANGAVSAPRWPLEH
jgi:FkbM family methyltransferase